jgi:hypothetical protein
MYKTITEIHTKQALVSQRLKKLNDSPSGTLLPLPTAADQMRNKQFVHCVQHVRERLLLDQREGKHRVGDLAKILKFR